MHPIERLRHVARAGGVDPALLLREAAGALAGFSDDPPGLVTACRRLVDRHPTVAPIWWLAARVLVAGDPRQAAWQAAQEVAEDRTARHLVADLPHDATVVVLGWPDLCAEVLPRRADVEVLVIDSFGYARAFAERLQDVGVTAHAVPESGLGPAAAEADLILLEAAALGPGGIVAVAGSRAAAAVGRHAGAEVWAVAGAGRVLPGRLWEALALRLDQSDCEAWDQSEELVPADLIDRVAGPAGTEAFEEAVKRADCPVTPELLKSL